MARKTSRRTLFTIRFHSEATQRNAPSPYFAESFRISSNPLPSGNPKSLTLALNLERS